MNREHYHAMLDQEAWVNRFRADVCTFLEWVQERPKSLTEAGNIPLKHLSEINKRFIQYRSMEEKIGDKVYQVRSEYQMAYLNTIDTLTWSACLTVREKRRLEIVNVAKAEFDSLSYGEQYINLWRWFAHALEWDTIQYLVQDASNAQMLQRSQGEIWKHLLNMDKKYRGADIPLERTLETLRDWLCVTWNTAHGDNPDLARSSIERIIFIRFLKPMDAVWMDRMNPKHETYSLTPLGRAALKLEVQKKSV